MDPYRLDASAANVPTATAALRQRLRELADLLPAPALADLRAIVNELVGNCVAHGPGATIRLVVEVARDGFVRGTVGDGSVPSPDIRPASQSGDTGIGLLIVDTLASRWGVDVASKNVWFELAPQV